jgi:hypothetical protein
MRPPCGLDALGETRGRRGVLQPLEYWMLSWATRRLRCQRESSPMAAGARISLSPELACTNARLRCGSTMPFRAIGRIYRMTGMRSWVLPGCVAICGLGCEGPVEAVVPPPATAPATGAAPAEAAASPVSMQFSFASDMRRVGGVEEGGALVCRKDQCKPGIVAFGPYTRAVPPGPRVATFLVGGSGISSIDGQVASFDVYDALGKKQLATRAIKGTELSNDGEGGFELAFVAPQQSNLEFRVGWQGDGELKLHRVDLR